MNSLNSEHLNPWEKPIQVCFDYVRNSKVQEILYWLWLNRWVDYYSWIFRNKIMWNINHEENSYVISPVNWKNKISRWYYDCTWLVIIWKDKNWRHISLLTHQDPKYLFCRYDSYDKWMKFKNDLQVKIDELKQKCIPWSIDAFIVWWNYIKQNNDFNDGEFDIKVNYRQSVELLRGIVFSNFWFYPCVAWPILDCWFTDIVVDSKNRRILHKRWKEDDFINLDNTLFQADKLEETIHELDEKCKIKKVPIWEVFT